jgi:hypothetical protein
MLGRAMGSSPARPRSVFERHARLTGLVLVIAAAVLADFGFTFVYSLYGPDFYKDRSAFRIPSEIYHHGFQLGVSVDDERWGCLVSSGWRVVVIGDSFTERIGLTVAVYPWPDQVLLGDRDSIQAAYWRAWAAENKTGFLDYFPLFVGVGDPRETVRRDFIAGDIHWNEAGHRVIADLLVQHLLSVAPHVPQTRGGG